MKIKAFSASLLTVLLFATLLSSCKEKNPEPTISEKTTTTDYTPVTFTTQINGKNQTAYKLDGDDKNYNIGCIDENGNGNRLEKYTDGKLSYYILSDFDENGNETKQNYYSADGKLLATVESGKIFDSQKKEISEDELNRLLK